MSTRRQGGWSCHRRTLLCLPWVLVCEKQRNRPQKMQVFTKRPKDVTKWSQEWLWAFERILALYGMGDGGRENRLRLIAVFIIYKNPPTHFLNIQSPIHLFQKHLFCNAMLHFIIYTTIFSFHFQYNITSISGKVLHL